MACEDQGVFTRLLFEPAAAPHTFNASSERYEFLFENLAKHGRIIGGQGIRGTRAPSVERTRAGAYYTFGSITMNVDPLSLVTLLPKILGAAAVGTTFSLDEAIPFFGVMIDRGADVFEYTDCKINRAIFRGRAPQLGEEGEPDLLTLQLDIVGTTESRAQDWPGTAPALSTSAAAAPYVFSDGVITLKAATWNITQFVLVIDNHLQARFTNSLTPTSICPRDRTVQLAVAVPWETAAAHVTTGLYEQALAGAAGILTFTNGLVSTRFDFGALQVPAESPTVPGKRGIDLELNMIARKTGTTPELVVTNDSTP